jgi:hypothetical protein
MIVIIDKRTAPHGNHEGLFVINASMDGEKNPAFPNKT